MLMKYDTGEISSIIKILILAKISINDSGQVEI